MEDSHVLVVTGGGILLIGGDSELVALLDGDVLVVDGVSGTDLRTFLRGGLEAMEDKIAKVGQLTVSRAMARGRPF